MDRPETRHWRGTWVALLALLSVCAPFLALFGPTEPVGVAFDHPARIGYYRQIVLSLGVGIVLGISVLVLRRRTAPAWIRYLSVTLGLAGIAVGMLALLTLVGLCGPTVLWGYCQP